MEPHYRTPQYQFFFAAEDGDVSTMKEMLASGEVDIDACDDFGDNALSIVTEKYEQDALSFLLDMGADPNQQNINDGQPPLLRAILNDNMDALETLLHSGADINGRDKENKYTALMWATTCGLDDYVEYLLRAGASRAARDTEGQTADMMAQSSKNATLTNIFDRHKNAKFRNLKGYVRKLRLKR